MFYNVTLREALPFEDATFDVIYSKSFMNIYTIRSVI